MVELQVNKRWICNVMENYICVRYSKPIKSQRSIWVCVCACLSVCLCVCVRVHPCVHACLCTCKRMCVCLAQVVLGGLLSHYIHTQVKWRAVALTFSNVLYSKKTTHCKPIRVVSFLIQHLSLSPSHVCIRWSCSGSYPLEPVNAANHEYLVK